MFVAQLFINLIPLIEKDALTSGQKSFEFDGCLDCIEQIRNKDQKKL